MIGQRSPILPPFPSQGLVLWLRSDIGVEFANGAISGWLDLSGNNNHAIAAAATAPTYTASDSNWNNLPSLTFAAGQQMTIASSASLQVTGPLTLVSVVRSTNTSGFNTLISKGPSNQEYDHYWKSTVIAGLRHSASDMDSASVPAQNAATIVVWTTDASAQQQIYLNGVAQVQTVTAFTAGLSTSNPVMIGERSDAGTQLIGSAVEFMIFNAFQGGCQALHQYLGDRYNISVPVTS